MEKLNQIIESMALAQFKADTKGTEKLNAFMLEHATVGELFEFFSTKKANDRTYLRQYGYCRLGHMGGIAEMFRSEVLWPKLKDKYIEDVVKNLENKLETTYKITIEQI